MMEMFHKMNLAVLAIFPKLKRDAFSGRHNNLHAISSDMAT